VEAYDPVHPQVQEAVGILIDILNEKGNLFDAERYAQDTYGNLRDKKNGINQESESVAAGAYNLADVIFQQKGDLIKAEELARESLRIRSLIHDKNYQNIGQSCSQVANVLMAQGKLGDETRGLFEHFLAISFRNSGLDGPNTATGNYHLGSYHAHQETTVDVKQTRQTQLLLAKSYFEEALRIFLKIYGPTHPHTVAAASQLAIVSRELSSYSLP
jgi:tetratricopeptide (TPR) repeat protein